MRTVKGWLEPGRSLVALGRERYRRELTQDGAFSVSGILETTAREHGLESGGGSWRGRNVGLHSGLLGATALRTAAWDHHLRVATPTMPPAR